MRLNRPFAPSQELTHAHLEPFAEFCNSHGRALNALYPKIWKVVNVRCPPLWLTLQITFDSKDTLCALLPKTPYVSWKKSVR
jgi:hypothetical protein